MVTYHLENLTLTMIFSGIVTVIGFKDKILMQEVREISVGREIEMMYLKLNHFI